jgi:hypothetical protein
MRTQILVDNLVVTSDVQSASATFHMPKTVRGIAQYTTSALSGFSLPPKIKLQGKLTEDHGWVDVGDTEKQITLDGALAIEDITLYPIMRCDINITGIGTITCSVHVGA